MVSNESSDSQYLWSESNVIPRQNKEDIALGMTKVNADGSHRRQTELGGTQMAEKATLPFYLYGEANTVCQASQGTGVAETLWRQDNLDITLLIRGL